MGLEPGDTVPHASTIGQNRHRRFDGTDVFEDVVELAMTLRCIDGTGLYTDSTRLKANASEHEWKRKHGRNNARRYLDDLGRAVNADRTEYGKKPSRQIKDTVQPRSSVSV